MDAKQDLPKNNFTIGFCFSDGTTSQKKKTMKSVSTLSTMHAGKLTDPGNKHKLTVKTVLKFDKVVN